MKHFLLGVDNGGTLVKAALFDLTGHEIAVASFQTPLLTERPGYNERDMEALWESNCRCIKEVLKKSKVSPSDVAGVAVCGHGKGLYPWGKDNRPACNGIVSTDNRAWRYPEKWYSNGTAKELFPLLCQRIIPCQQASLLAWMKDNQRRIYDNIKWTFSVKDYIRFRLTGEAYSEATDISGSGLMDVRHATFDRLITERLGIAEAFDMLAPLRFSSQQCGAITGESAALTGLVEGTPVAGGMFDIDACAIAMNITDPSQLCSITGTWSINEFISPAPITGTQIAMNSLYAIPGFYLLEECSATGAGNLEWFLQNFMENDPLLNGENIYEAVNQAVASVDPADCEVYYLPFLYGSNMHPLAKGSFVGLTSYHTKAHMLRAIFEGVAFSHKTHIDRLLSARSAPSAIRMAGGAVNSPVWVKLFADVLETPIETVVGVSELGALGCAMAAAIAAGIYSDYNEAAKHMVRINPPVLPNPKASEIYREKYKKYSAVSRALDSVWDSFTV